MTAVRRNVSIPGDAYLHSYLQISHQSIYIYVHVCVYILIYEYIHIQFIYTYIYVYVYVYTMYMNSIPHFHDHPSAWARGIHSGAQLALNLPPLSEVSQHWGRYHEIDMTVQSIVSMIPLLAELTSQSWD